MTERENTSSFSFPKWTELNGKQAKYSHDLIAPDHKNSYCISAGNMSLLALHSQHVFLESSSPSQSQGPLLDISGLHGMPK